MYLIRIWTTTGRYLLLLHTGYFTDIEDLVLSKIKSGIYREYETVEFSINIPFQLDSQEVIIDQYYNLCFDENLKEKTCTILQLVDGETIPWKEQRKGIIVIEKKYIYI